MLGCQGYIGYVFVPKSQQEFSPKNPYTIVNNESYKVNGKNLLFREYGLPKVNDIVTLNIFTPLLENHEIRKNKEELLKWYEIYDHKTFTAEIRRYELDAAFPMAAGAKLRILGYRTFYEVLGEMKLFALVMVITND